MYTPQERRPRMQVSWAKEDAYGGTLLWEVQTLSPTRQRYITGCEEFRREWPCVRFGGIFFSHRGQGSVLKCSKIDVTAVKFSPCIELKLSHKERFEPSNAKLSPSHFSDPLCAS